MPEERRMTITSSSHLAPDDVARHTFASVRRGFDPTEVRDYLESIASGLRAHAEREQELLAALADADRRCR
jgi:DivIVA domain-containing protein